MRRLALWWVRFRGWVIEGEAPSEPKTVGVGAPHTSNWDFVLFLAVAEHFGLTVRFIAKQSLFRWPLGWLMRRMGGIPIVRDTGQGLVEQVVAEIGRSGPMMLVITPEGTRGAAQHWRSGFYRIAQGARIPMTLGFVDYPRKRAGLGPSFHPSGDLPADMDRIRTFFADKVGRHPELAGPVQLLEEEADPTSS